MNKKQTIYTIFLAAHTAVQSFFVMVWVNVWIQTMFTMNASLDVKMVISRAKKLANLHHCLKNSMADLLRSAYF